MNNNFNFRDIVPFSMFLFLIEMTFGQILKELYLDKENYMMKTTTITSFIFYIVNDRRCRMQ